MIAERIALIILLPGIFAAGCGRSAPESTVSAQSSPPNAILSAEPRFVSFGGVSFRYDPKVFGNVEQTVVEEHRLEEPTDKPDSVAPKHIEFTFDFGPRYWEGFLHIYPVKDFPSVYVVNPASLRGMKSEIKALRKVLKNKDFRSVGQIPYLPFVDGSQSFQTNVKLSPFQNGNGIFFVTHWSTEAALISNAHLRYVFEGLSDDGKYYVLAEIPISVNFLPEDSPDEFEGYKERYLYDDYRTKDTIRPRYQDYISSITTRLEKTIGR